MASLGTLLSSVSLTFVLGRPSSLLRRRSSGSNTRKKYRPCASSQDFLNWDPFEEFFGPYTDSSRKSLTTSCLRSWYGEDGELISKLPCPSCRGRGYVTCPICDVSMPEVLCLECSGKGVKTCTECLGNRSVLVKQVCETLWKATNPRESPFQIEDDMAIENMEIPLRPERKPNRVYSSPPAEVREKIRCALKKLDAQTGSVTRRMRRIHNDPVLRAKRIAAIKKAKSTEAARKHMSERLKLFFQNPENRRLHSLRLKGLPFYCSYCGLRGHRRHYCPHLRPSRRKERIYRCSQCGLAGHKCTSCKMFSSLCRTPPQEVKRNYKCGICSKYGHNSRTCSRKAKIATSRKADNDNVGGNLPETVITT